MNDSKLKKKIWVLEHSMLYFGLVYLDSLKRFLLGLKAAGPDICRLLYSYVVPTWQFPRYAITHFENSKQLLVSGGTGIQNPGFD